MFSPLTVRGQLPQLHPRFALRATVAAGAPLQNREAKTSLERPAQSSYLLVGRAWSVTCNMWMNTFHKFRFWQVRKGLRKMASFFLSSERKIEP